VNWEAIGALAELTAAIAVLPTLLYLAVQLRQNTRALKSGTIDSLNASMAENARTIAENPEIITLLVKAESGESLSEAERARYHYLLIMLVRRFEGFYFQTSLGFLDPKMTMGYERSMISIIGRNRSWWASSNAAFSVDFVSYVDGCLESGIPDPVHPGFGSTRDDA